MRKLAAFAFVNLIFAALMATHIFEPTLFSNPLNDWVGAHLPLGNGLIGVFILWGVWIPTAVFLLSCAPPLPRLSLWLSYIAYLFSFSAIVDLLICIDFYRTGDFRLLVVPEAFVTYLTIFSGPMLLAALAVSAFERSVRAKQRR